MAKRRQWIIGIAVLVGVAVLAALFPLLFEKVEVEETSNYSVKAQHNPFLAAERYLKALNTDVETLRGFKKLQQFPSTGDTLIATYNHTFELPARRDELLRWIRDGGHLILELKAHTTVDHAKVDTPLLDQFGVYPVRKDMLLQKITEQAIEVRVYQGDENLKVEFDPQFSLTLNNPDSAMYNIKDTNGVHLVEYELGHGWVTLMSDMDIWRNRHIGEYDHAAFLSHILGFQKGKVWIIANITVPSLFEMIWNKAPQVVVATMILLLLWLWTLYDRFGPLAEIEYQQRRSLIEHLDAVAHFNWRFNRSEVPLTVIRKDLQRLLEKRCPHWNRMSGDQQVEWINAHTGLPEVTIRAALFETCDQASRFMRIAADLQTIRNQL